MLYEVILKVAVVVVHQPILHGVWPFYTRKSFTKEPQDMLGKTGNLFNVP